MSRKMLKGGVSIDNSDIDNFITIYKSVPDISSDQSSQQYKKNIKGSFSKIFGARLELTNNQKKMLSDELGIDVNTPGVSFNVDAGTTFADKQIEAAQAADKQSVGLYDDSSSSSKLPLYESARTAAVSQEEVKSLLDMNASKSTQLSPKKLSDITSDDGDIGYTIDEVGTISKKDGKPDPDRGKNQKAFIIKKSEEIKTELDKPAIKQRVNSDAITNYNDAMTAAQSYLREGFTHTTIQGGKRSRRRRSKTRSRRTKNKRKKLYKR